MKAYWSLLAACIIPKLAACIIPKYVNSLFSSLSDGRSLDNGAQAIDSVQEPSGQKPGVRNSLFDWLPTKMNGRIMFKCKTETMP